MRPNDDRARDELTRNGQSNGLRELQPTSDPEKSGRRMAETSVVDVCAENKICGGTGRDGIGNSTTSLQSCSCGPECGPDKCDGRKSTSLVAWDETRTKMFILLIAAFAVWLLIYIPISITTVKGSNDAPDEG